MDGTALLNRSGLDKTAPPSHFVSIPAEWTILFQRSSSELISLPLKRTSAPRSEQTEIFERQVSVSSGHPLPSSADMSISQYVAIREVAGSAR